MAGMWMLGASLDIVRGCACLPGSRLCKLVIYLSIVSKDLFLYIYFLIILL